MRAWNPLLSHDTVVYYERAVNAGFAKSFFVDRRVTDFPEHPDASEARSVFVASLNAANSFHHALGFTKHFFADYIAFTSVMAFAIFLLFVAQFMPLGFAALSSVIIFINPWALSAAYFSSYVSVSIFLFIAMLWFLYVSKKPFWGGVFLALNIWVNLSFLQFFLVLMLVELFREKKQWFRHALRIGAGSAVVCLVLEAIVLFTNLIHKTDYLSQLDIIRRYLLRSLHERTNAFQTPGTSFFIEHLQLVSLPFLIFVSSGLVLFLWNAIRKKRESLKDPLFLLFMSSFVALLLFDFRAGPRFSRTYFVLFLFFGVAAVEGFRLALQSWKPQFRHYGVAALVLVCTGVQWLSSLGVSELNFVFTQPGRIIDENFAQQNKVAIFKADRYRPVFFQYAGVAPFTPQVDSLQEVDSICELFTETTTKRYVLVSPNQGSIVGFPAHIIYRVPLPLGAHWEMKDAQTGNCSTFKWKAEIASKVPFFSHYPFFVLEDPSQTNVLMHGKQFGYNDYRDGFGALTLWSVQKL